MGILRKFKYNSPVILTYTFLSFVALLLSYGTYGEANTLIFSVYRGSATDPLSYLRFFTHVLGHVNFEHFFNNFIIILLIGPMLEEKYSSKLLLALMVSTALCTGILHVAFSNAALLGASGIVFFMILLSSFANFEKGRIPITLILIIIIFIGREVMYIFTSNDNVARLTHIFGGVVGAISGYWINHRTVIDN